MARASSLSVQFALEGRARRAFVRELRRYVLDTGAKSLKDDFLSHVEQRLPVPQTPRAIHEAMRVRDAFRFYSALRTSSQDFLYQSIRPEIEHQAVAINTFAADLRHRRGPGSLELDSALVVPRSVSAVDIHLMPGSYHTEYAPNDVTIGCVYDERLRISTFGLFGPDLGDIGRSISKFAAIHMEGLTPTRILDLGCTVGHNTLPWKEAFPAAEVHGIDVSAPCLRYAHARARDRRIAIHFKQMNACHLRYPDQSFDVVFSSMFLHEIPRREISVILREAFRLLRPGGLMLHMELPPANQLAPWDSFYLDWDGHYNNEPFYRSFRAMDLRKIVADAGFRSNRYIQYVVPSIHALGAKRWHKEIQRALPVSDDKTGRLTTGVRWFVFGARK